VLEPVKWDKDAKAELTAYLVKSYQQKHLARIPWMGDKLVEFPVYRVPIDILSFNFNNTRIRSELEGYLHKERKKINPKDLKQQTQVQTILLESRWFGDIETQRLWEDLEKHGQVDPAIATPDGILIDGNRRLAIFQKKQALTQSVSHMDVCILPENSTQDDLKALEMRLQMTKPFKVQYGNINTALEFRYLHRELGWELRTIEEVTGKYYKERTILEMIKTIDLIDDYLNQIPEPGTHSKQYTELDKGWEAFSNLHSLLKWSNEKDLADESETVKRKSLGFQIIFDEDTTYADVRRLYAVLKEPQTKELLAESSHTLKGYNKNIFKKEHVKEEITNLREIYNTWSEIHGGPHKIAKDILKKIDKMKVRKSMGDPELVDLFQKIIDRISELQRRVR